MAAYYGPVIGAVLLCLFFGGTLNDIARELKRIADCLESQKDNTSSKESE